MNIALLYITHCDIIIVAWSLSLSVERRVLIIDVVSHRRC